MERLDTESYAGSYLSHSKENLPLIKKMKWRKNETEAYKKEYAVLVFILEGACSLVPEKYPPCVIRAGEMFFIPPRRSFSAKATEDLLCLVVKIEDYIYMYDELNLERLKNPFPDKTLKINPVPVKPVAGLFVESLAVFLDDGLTESYFHELKIKEIIFILKSYYNQEELRQLFHPVLSQNFTFANFVLTHYLFVRTVKELAKLSPYSLSGFDKEFKKVFHTTPYQWMIGRRAERVYYDIKYTNKPLKDIAENAGFSNLSQLCDFCRLHFKKSPGKMRKL